MGYGLTLKKQDGTEIIGASFSSRSLEGLLRDLPLTEKQLLKLWRSAVRSSSNGILLGPRKAAQLRKRAEGSRSAYEKWFYEPLLKAEAGDILQML